MSDLIRCGKALDNPVEGVTSFKEESGRSSAAIDDSVFEVSVKLMIPWLFNGF